MNLDNTLVGKRLRVISTNFDEESLSEKLSSIGIVPNEIITVNAHSKLNVSTVYVVVRDVEYAIRLDDAKKVEVEVIDAM